MLALIFAVAFAALWGQIARQSLSRASPGTKLNATQKRALIFAYGHGGGVGVIIGLGAKTLDGATLAALFGTWGLILWFAVFKLEWFKGGRPSFPAFRLANTGPRSRFAGLDRHLLLTVGLLVCMVGGSIQWDDVSQGAGPSSSSAFVDCGGGYCSSTGRSSTEDCDPKRRTNVFGFTANRDVASTRSDPLVY